jgi:hypothetical protein
VKWLKMNATCPLCKYNILKGNEQVWLIVKKIHDIISIQF